MHLDRPLTPPELDRRARARRATRGGASRSSTSSASGASGGSRSRVDRRALIPRPETETLVERCLALLDGDERAARARRRHRVGRDRARARRRAPRRARDRDRRLRATRSRSPARTRERTGLAVELVRARPLRRPAGRTAGTSSSRIRPTSTRTSSATLEPEVARLGARAALFGRRAHRGASPRAAPGVLRPGGASCSRSATGRRGAVAALLERARLRRRCADDPDLTGRDRVVEGQTSD